ncbi:MAG: outer membrane beta-barrel protein [Phycisphaerales bacterium]
MRRSLILLSAICLVLAGVTSGSVKKGDLEIEVLGGLAMESGAGEGDDQASILAGETGADLDGWFGSVGIGYFTSRNFEIGIAGFGSWLDGSETPSYVINPAFPNTLASYDIDIDTTVYGGGGRVKWHFSPGKSLVPYVGANVSWATADVDISGTARMVSDGEIVPDSEANISESDSASGILWGPIVGLRLQLARRMEVLLEYQYHMWSGDISDLVDDGHAISAGLCLRLK